jgi:tetratricopeptide (TPR) repeat protein
MLVASGETHRLADEALRAVLLEGLSVQQIRELHLSLGQALADSLAIPPGGSLAKATAAELLVLLQAGFHFAEAHDDPGGRGLLSEAGIELTHRGEGLAAAIPALETALRSYVEAGRSAFDRALLMFPLTLAGSYVDFRLTYRYGEELIGVLADIAGMTLASRLRRYLGGKLAFAVGLGVGILRYPLIARSKSRRRFHELFLGLISMTTAIVAVATPLLDRALARRALRRIDPLRSLPMSVPARLVYEFALSMSEGIDGHFAVARTRARFVLLRMRRPGGVRFMPEDARVQLELGILMFVGSIEAMRTDGAVHGTLAALDSHVTANARQVAAGVRATYHAHRGERALFEEQQREVDALAAGVGSTWRQDVLLARNGWWPHAMCEDVMGLKHCVRQLDSMSQDAPSLTLMRDAAHASYLGARGMHREALQKYEKVLAAGAEPATELSMRLIATLARLLRLSDRSVEAEALCRRALGAMTTAQLEFAALVHSVQLEHALSLFSLERRDESIELLEELLVAQQAHDNALLRGLTHKARAQVALALGEAATFRGHLSSMGEWFRLTENPSLIAQLHSLEDEGARAGFLPDARHQAAIVRKVLAGNEATIRATFGRCRGPSDRLQTALNMVIDATSAERGYLYLLNEEGGLRFAAPVVGLEPPDDLKRELAEQLDVFRQKEDVTSGGDGAEPSGMRTVVGDEDRPAVSVSPVSAAPPVSPATYRSVFLAIPREGRFVAVGAVALVAGAEPLRAIDVATLEEIARGIYDAADVQTVFFGAEPRNASSSRSQGSGPPRSGPDSVKTRLEAPAWHGSRTAGRKFVPG